MIACPPMGGMSGHHERIRCEAPVHAPSVRPPTEPCCEWELRNACVAYVSGSSRHRHYTLLADASSGVLRPLAFPGHFEEGTTKLRPERALPASITSALFASSLPRVWHGDDALVVDMSFDNVWHTLFHAIPTRQSILRRGLSPARMTLLPRYINQWPASPNVSHWSGWEVLVRSLLGSACRQLAATIAVVCPS